MKSHCYRFFTFLILFTLAACNGQPIPPTSVPTQPATESPTLAPSATLPPSASPTLPPTEPALNEQPLYLAIIWHQHQPVYFKDPDTGIYSKPWVRVHASKDYVDMAAIFQQYPNIHATFNLTPSLLRQVDDLANGAKDLYWVMAEVPAEELTAEQKQFLLDRFFDTNRKIVARFPRYQELLTQRDADGAFSTQDYRDLQIWFNLAWTDPDWLAQEPLASLVARGRDFTEDDKQMLFAEHLRLIQEIIPIHKQLQDAGQIEVTMTPFAHPILPLIADTNLALEALPDLTMPDQRFFYYQDAVAQVNLGVGLYTDYFGQAPRGMWPAEGSVAQMIVPMVSQAGVQWMASDEGVLAKSLGLDGFTRNAAEVVASPDQLYRPYYVQGQTGDPVAIVFRDVVISDKVGFTYSSMPGASAAEDFIRRIHAIRQVLADSGATGPHLVSVILDGENAWEHYDNDGKEFLHALYAGLSSDPLIKTVTPSEYLAMYPEQPKIEKLWAGSWINHDFSTWIGEEEENRAWDYLATVRAHLKEYEAGAYKASAEAIEQALMMMYIAEGSDWFWWYGADQDSGDDASFDQQYRDTLKQVYIALGEQPPAFLDAPIIEQRTIAADVASTGLTTPQVDGVLAEGEWDAAGVYQASGGAMAAAAPFFESLAYGFNAKNLYFRVIPDARFSSLTGEDHVEIYIGGPGGVRASSFSRNQSVLGFQAHSMISVNFRDRAATLYIADEQAQWNPATGEIQVAFELNTGAFELGIPLELLGSPNTGDRLRLRAIHIEPLSGLPGSIDSDLLPGPGPAILTVPDLAVISLVLNVDDPAGDDYGPGTYLYPTDSVFKPGVFDILNFQVGSDDENIIFIFTMNGPVENPWNSPNGLAIQTFDIYIDQDGDGVGGRTMLPGRNLAFDDGYAWDFAITVEGWDYGIYNLDGDNLNKVAQSSRINILADAGQQKVTVRVPKAILGNTPEAWKYAAVVLSQEGYPSPGVMRVRNGKPDAAQWNFGGTPDGASNYTRVFDFVWPEPGAQETWLSAFTPSSAGQSDLTVADFARVPMLALPE